MADRFDLCFAFLDVVFSAEIDAGLQGLTDPTFLHFFCDGHQPDLRDLSPCSGCGSGDAFSDFRDIIPDCFLDHVDLLKR